MNNQTKNTIENLLTFVDGYPYPSWQQHIAMALSYNNIRILNILDETTRIDQATKHTQILSEHRLTTVEITNTKIKANLYEVSFNLLNIKYTLHTTEPFDI